MKHPRFHTLLLSSLLLMAPAISKAQGEAESDVVRHIKVTPRDLHIETALLKKGRHVARIVIPKGNP